MKCRPIIMGAESVRAILEGRKTQTRRVIKPQPSVSYHWSGDAYEEGGMVKAVLSSKPTIHFDYMPKCRWQVGDRLWVRETVFFETFHQQSDEELKRDGFNPNIGVWVYRADNHEYPTITANWTSPMFMPREASRITLKITDIRVERVQDISAKDAIAEGIPAPYVARDEFEPISMYQKQWNKLNAKRGYPWESNPWVWCIGFKRVHDQKEDV